MEKARIILIFCAVFTALLLLKLAVIFSPRLVSIQKPYLWVNNSEKEEYLGADVIGVFFFKTLVALPPSSSNNLYCVFVFVQVTKHQYRVLTKDKLKVGIPAFKFLFTKGGNSACFLELQFSNNHTTLLEFLEGG